MSEILGEETLVRMRDIERTPSPLKRGVRGSPLRVMFSTPLSSYVPRQVMSERAPRRNIEKSLVSPEFTTPSREMAVRETWTSPRKKPAAMLGGRSLPGVVSSTILDSSYSREKGALEAQYKRFKILNLIYPILSVKEMKARICRCEEAMKRRQQKRIIKDLAKRDEQWQEYEKRVTRKFILKEKELQETNEALQIKTQELSVRIEQLEEQLEKEREEKGVIQLKTDRVVRRHTLLERELSDREEALAKLHAEMEKLDKAFSILQQQKEVLQRRETEEQEFAEAQIGGLKKQDEERLARIRELVQENKEKEKELIFLRNRLEQIETLKMDEYERRLKQAAEIRSRLEKENRELREYLASMQLSMKDKEENIAALQTQLIQIQSTMQRQTEFVESQQQIISQLREENDELHATSSTQSGVSLASEMLELRFDALQQQLDKERAEHNAELARTKQYAVELEEELENASVSLAKASERNLVLSKEKIEQQEVFREQLSRMTIAFEEEKKKREEYKQALKLFASSSGKPSSTRESIVASGSNGGLFFSSAGNADSAEETSSLDLSAILQGNDEAVDKELTTRVGLSARRL